MCQLPQGMVSGMLKLDISTVIPMLYRTLGRRIFWMLQNPLLGSFWSTAQVLEPAKRSSRLITWATGGAGGSWGVVSYSSTSSAMATIPRLYYIGFTRTCRCRCRCSCYCSCCCCCCCCCYCWLRRCVDAPMFRRIPAPNEKPAFKGKLLKTRSWRGNRPQHLLNNRWLESVPRPKKIRCCRKLGLVLA